MGKQEFLPFYEKMANRLSNRYVNSRVAVSVILGLIFLIPHYAAQFWAGEKKFDWSWFLAVLIAGAILCLYYATYALKALLPEMESRLDKPDQQILVPLLPKTLSDRNFALA